MKEIETKFKINNPSAFKKRLSGIGARYQGKELQHDIYYCRKGGPPVPVVRLRMLGKSKSIFTVKTAPKGPVPRGLKIRQEYETGVEDPATLDRMLRLMGYAVWFEKEKKRAAYAWEACHFFLDELPYIGWYLEIEATHKKINDAARRLGLAMEDAIPETYLELFNYYKLLYKKPDVTLVFPGHSS